MSDLVDTDTCSAHLKNHLSVTNRLVQYAAHIHLSVVTVGELWTGALRNNAPARRSRGIQDFISNATILDVDQLVAAKFGELRAGLLDAGRPSPDMDLLIAATALVHNLTLVTHNQKDFTNIPGLRLDDWLTP